MIRKTLLLITISVFVIPQFIANVFASGQSAVSSKSIVGSSNPLHVTKFILPNGLQVFLNEDHSKPEISGSVVVRAGSRHDPADATGIAHYFEHIMFKGTDKIGTTDWEAEKVYLDSISAAYDLLAATQDDTQRKDIQSEINRLSKKAAEFAIPNETDVLLRDIGGSNLNAGTGYEMTVYYNSFPSYQIEKWMDIYAERFKNPVFRLFQAELETVYEEKNLYSDIPVQAMIEDVLATIYGKHPYSNPILGQTEHLKNPRLSKMMDFFDTWYVANNMALILSGSFNTEEVVPMIEEKFGTWRSGELPEIPDYKLDPFNGREFRKVRMSPIRIGLVAFRGVSVNHPDNTVFEVASHLLSNSSSTGIFDKMVMDNKIMAIQPLAFQAPDHGTYVILSVPKIVGQSLKSAESLVDEGLETLKNGDFSDELLEAVKLEYRKNLMRQLETPEGRAGLLRDAFIDGMDWEKVLSKTGELDLVTKEDIIRVTQEYLADDRLVYWSRMGFPKKDKLQKPDWEPIIPQNTEERSEFAKMINEKPELPAEPIFVNFGEDVVIQALPGSHELYYTGNPYNDIFTMQLAFKKGILHDKLLENTAYYMNLIGTESMTFSELKNELQKLGASIDFSVSNNLFSIYIEGFDENLPRVLELVSDIIENPKPDESQIEKLWQEKKAYNKMMRSDPMEIGDALYDYALYREKSQYLNTLTFKETKKLDAQELMESFRAASKQKALLIYAGKTPIDELAGIINSKLPLASQPVLTEPEELSRMEYNENAVFYHHNRKARQSNINFYVQGSNLPDIESRAHAVAFNEYFGSGMSSLVFQEIREFRSLSYAAYSVYRQPFLPRNPGFLMGYMNTQSDKTMDGIQAMSELITEMPARPERLEGIRKGLIQSVYTSRPGFRSMGAAVAHWRMQGFDADPQELYYPVFQKLEFDNIEDFYNSHISNKPMLITVSGNMKKVDKELFDSFGKPVKLKYKEFIKE
jgi:predicted Zn-dependent peptidase